MEKIAFLFTGLGAQFVGMTKGLYDKYEVAKRTFEEANDLLEYDIAKLCFDGPLGDLAKTENAQPALLTASVATYRVYMKEVGIAPHFSAGHSLGEYSALVSAGAMRFRDAIRLVRQRGLFTKEIVDSDTGEMAIIDLTDETNLMQQIRKVTEDDSVIINCFNSPAQFAIAGFRDKVEKVGELMLDLGAEVTPLIGGAPIHTMLMKRAAERLSEELPRYTFYKFKWPVITNLTGQPYSDSKMITETLVKQITSPVQWIKTMNYMKEYGITAVVEMGPLNVLTKLVEANAPGMRAFCYGIKDDRSKIIELLENEIQKDKDRSAA